MRRFIPKKRNPLAKKLTDPRYTQRVVPPKATLTAGKLKAIENYRHAIGEIKHDAQGIAGRCSGSGVWGPTRRPMRRLARSTTRPSRGIRGMTSITRGAGARCLTRQLSSFRRYRIRHSRICQPSPCARHAGRGDEGRQRCHPCPYHGHTERRRHLVGLLLGQGCMRQIPRRQRCLAPRGRARRYQLITCI